MPHQDPDLRRAAARQGGRGNKGRPKSPEHRRKISEAARASAKCRQRAEKLKGRKMTAEQRRKLSEAQKGKQLTPQHRQAVSRGRHRRYGSTPESSKRRAIRNVRSRFTPEYFEWLKAVWKKAGGRCQHCGAKPTKTLKFQCHHKKSWALHPELRYDPDNGELLCFPCHKLTDSYGRSRSRQLQQQQRADEDVA